jgi:phage terminase large subunit GpA-like protein
MTHSTAYQQQLQHNSEKLQTRLTSLWAVPRISSAFEWACNNRIYAIGESPKAGKFNPDTAPWLRGMLEAVSDKAIREIVVLKASGVMISNGFLTNVIGWKMHTNPCDIIGMLPNSNLAAAFMEEKIHRMIKGTAALHDRINVTKKSTGNRRQYLNFGSGFLAIEGSNSIANLQSRHVPLGFSDEMDRCIAESKHGTSIQNLRDRLKSFDNSLFIGTGSPSGVKGFSYTEERYLLSDMCKFFVPCNHCHEYQILSFDNVIYEQNAELEHPIFGDIDTKTAVYQCQHCHGTWSDAQKNLNVRKGEWRATAEFNGIRGYGGLEEIYSPVANSSFKNILEAYLIAKHALNGGDQSKMMDFYNTKRGLTYEYQSKAPKEHELASRAENYKELTVPKGGLWLTASVDVQSTGRFSVQLTAWGQDMECWVVYWNELHGKVTDKNDKVWKDLEALLTTPVLHAHYGVNMKIEAIDIDASDGNTADIVYEFVRRLQRKGINIMAIKGSSSDYGSKEIFSRPKGIEYKGYKNTKAAKYGIHVHIVGTHRAKDRIFSGLALTDVDTETGEVTTGRGAGRIHFYKDIRPDFYAQILSEVKIPSKHRGKEEYHKKANQANEALDNLVYNFHAAYSLKLHSKTPEQCAKREIELSQTTLFSEIESPVIAEKPIEKQKQPTTKSDWLNINTDNWIL